MGRLKLATVWLGGCSGCHMSFLDMDEYLLELADIADVVASPLVDTKVYPDGVDVVLVEGAVCNVENREMLRRVRERSRLLISFGDCAVTGNVSALRNLTPGPQSVLERSYLECADRDQQVPPSSDIVPELLEQVVPLHAVVAVDGYLPGCPPSGPTIRAVLARVLAGEPIGLADPRVHFGGSGIPSDLERFRAEGTGS